eukprot:m.171126 g.171126  ORF g.171126 m.171126 type:complete len:142 (-) comp13495_c2_seq2:3624-4049(-)
MHKMVWNKHANTKTHKHNYTRALTHSGWKETMAGVDCCGHCLAACFPTGMDTATGRQRGGDAATILGFLRPFVDTTIAPLFVCFVCLVDGGTFPVDDNDDDGALTRVAANNDERLFAYCGDLVEDNEEIEVDEGEATFPLL